MSGAPRRDRARYLVDRLFSKGTLVLVAWLVCSTVVAVVAIALVAFLTRASGASLPRLIWEGLQRVLDPGGVVSSGASEEGRVFKTAMIASSVVGVVALACLIGLVTTELVKVFDNLLRGRSRVVERDHSLILGWSEHVPQIVSETAIANANRPGRAIVILADHDPVELREALAGEIGATPGTRVVFRRGDPTNFNDLETAGFSEARSIVIVPGEHSHSDSIEIKTLLAVINHPRRRQEPYHVVVPLTEPNNESVVKMVAGDEVEAVVFRDVAARIVAQTCCQPGLSTVYTELLDFGGDEIYFHEEPGLVGKTFGEALLAYEDSAVVGLRPAGGLAVLWPGFETVVGAGDQIVAISGDDDTVRLSSKAAEIQTESICTGTVAEPEAQRTLILGWGPTVSAIVRELDAYVRPGSIVTVLACQDEVGSEIKKLAARLNNQRLSAIDGIPTDRATLDGLDLPAYNHIVVAGDGCSDRQETDAHAMLTLLHLRDIARRRGASFSLVTEMRDIRNRELAAAAEVDDFIVSEHLLSLLLVQIAENKQLAPILADLFDPEGAEVYIKPICDYVLCGVPVTFYTVVEAARRRGEIAIGYRLLKSEDSEAGLGFGIMLNPVKSKLVTFSEGDRVIVIAED